MNTRDSSGLNGPDPDRDEVLRKLFAHAQPRAVPPAADEAEIRSAVFAEWNAVTGRRVFWRRTSVAAAAAAVAVLGVLVVVQTGRGPALALATVERVQGNVELDGVRLLLGAAIPAGEPIATRSGQVALRLADGGSLRLAARTELTLSASAAVELDGGALYFDSESDTGATRLEVRTPFGTLHDVGTQFMARLEPAYLEVGVRDGRVTVMRDSDSVDVLTGDRVTVATSGNVRRESLATFGQDWAWAERLAPPFDIDGQPLDAFLTWVAGQTGRTLVFADAASEQIARDTLLKGSIDLEPLPKLAAVLTLTVLTYSIDGERIVVTVK